MSSQLPDDLLDLVYRRIACPLSHVRFAAVCRTWRAVASWRPPPPPLPMLLLSTYDRAKKKDLYCLEDGGVLRVRLSSTPKGVARKWIVGSHQGGWVAVVSAGCIMVLNLFSGVKVELSEEQSRIDPSDNSVDPSSVSKIIFSEEPTSETCIVAAITNGCMVALCRVSCAKGWTVKGCGMGCLKDIAFCHGELYGLRLNHQEVRLLKFGIGGAANELVLVTTIQAVVTRSLTFLLWEDDDYAHVHAIYIFEMDNMLTMAIKTGEYFFRLFELVMDVNTSYRWQEMTSLRDYALFLGPTCSTATKVCAEGRASVQRNIIYYSNERYGHLPIHKRYLTKMADGRAVYYDDDEIVCYDGKVIVSCGFYSEPGVQASIHVDMSSTIHKSLSMARHKLLMQ